jgi:predicted Zn-ribbon and HTH transcriptional regulator
MGKVMLEGFECERCGHKWVPRAATEDIPTICPKCKSPYWNKPRKTNTVDQAREAMKQKRKRVGDIG